MDQFHARLEPEQNRAGYNNLPSQQYEPLVRWYTSHHVRSQDTHTMQTASGAVACQLMDALHPGCVALGKVRSPDIVTRPLVASLFV